VVPWRLLSTSCCRCREDDRILFLLPIGWVDPGMRITWICNSLRSTTLDLLLPLSADTRVTDPVFSSTLSITFEGGVRKASSDRQYHPSSCPKYTKFFSTNVRQHPLYHPFVPFLCGADEIIVGYLSLVERTTVEFLAIYHHKIVWLTCPLLSLLLPPGPVVIIFVFCSGDG